MITHRLSALLFLILFGLGGHSLQAHMDCTTATKAVWQHHIEAWKDRDLDKITSDYTNESILIVNNRVYKGQKEIKEVFKKLFEIFDNGGNRIDEPTIKNRIVYITWHFTPFHEEEYFGTDTFVIENGKISYQTIASPLYEKHSEW